MERLEISILILLRISLLRANPSMYPAEKFIYPSIYWNPRNPIFACDQPKINIRIGESINFLCPSDEYNFFTPYTHTKMIYENLFFLGDDKNRYDKCDATGMQKLLNCDDSISSKHYKFMFRAFKTSKDSLKFVRGKTYYLIGTGFRDLSNLASTVNGSCRMTREKGEFKMRLQIYVCTDEEISSGKCNLCKSNGCYYQGCGLECTPWVSVGTLENDENCIKIQKRSCKQPYLSNEEKEEFQNISVECPAPKIRNTTQEPVTSYRIQPNPQASSVNIYIVVAVGFLCLLIGLVLGLVFYKVYLKHRSSKKKRHKGDGDDIGVNGTLNDTYKNSMEIKEELMYK